MSTFTLRLAVVLAALLLAFGYAVYDRVTSFVVLPVLAGVTFSVIQPRKVSGGSFRGDEDRKARYARMTAFWKDAKNTVLYPCGQFLALKYKDGTLADFIATKGNHLLIEAIQIGKRQFPLAEGFKLSLDSIQTWGCPACHSAHGSGIYPSREVDAQLLAENRWYYNPATKAFFVISTTCWKQYVVDLLGKDKVASHFTEAPDKPRPLVQPKTAHTLAEQVKAAVTSPVSAEPAKV